MRPIVTVQVAWSVSLSLMIVSCAKTAELIEMPFGARTLVGPRNHALDGGQNISTQTSNFDAEEVAHCGLTAVSCGKMAELIKMQLECRVGWVQGSVC